MGYLIKVGRVRFRKTSAMPLSSTKQSLFLRGEEIVESSKDCDAPIRLQSNLTIEERKFYTSSDVTNYCFQRN